MRSPIDNFNIDLMFGLPGQSLAQALDDVERALAAGPTHISPLPADPGAQHPVCCAAAGSCRMRSCAGTCRRPALSALRQPVLSSTKYPPGACRASECRHNLNYWQFGDYLGIGAGAHAKLSLPAQGEVRRQVKVRHPRRYLAGERLAGQRSRVRRGPGI